MTDDMERNTDLEKESILPSESQGFGKLLTGYGWALSVGAWVTLGAVLILNLPPDKPNIVHVLLISSYGLATTFGLFGFMFGLRVDENETHLQTIAEWLTKLLIGAGLVQLQTISDKTWNFAKGLAGDDLLVAYIYVFTMLSSASIGVVFGYLWSQLHYGSLKAEGDQEPV